MPWNGSGSFNRNNGQHSGATTWNLTAAAGRKIRTDDHDTHDEDLASGLENCVTRDGQNSPTTNLPMNDKRHTGVQDGVDRTDYASYGQVLDAMGYNVAPADVGGTGNTITLSPTPAVTALARHNVFRFFAKVANTGAVTIQVSSLAAVAFVDADGSAFEAGEISVGQYIVAIYDGTQFWSIARLSSGVAIGTAEGELATLATGGRFAKARLPSDTVYQAAIDALAPVATSGAYGDLTGTPAVPSVRTLLRSTSTNDWSNSTSVVSVTVPDIDDHAYITVTTMADVGGGSRRRAETTTFAVSDLPVGATPTETTAPIITITASANLPVAVGRDTAGTTLYFNPSSAVTGRVAAVWGGPF